MVSEPGSQERSAAIAAMRIKLLKTAVAYGLTLALHDGDLRTSKDLLALCEACLGAYAEAPAQGDAITWLDGLRLVVRQAEAGNLDQEWTALVPTDVSKELEGLEAACRSVELFGVEPMANGDSHLVAGSRLLGAAEDSLVLTLAPDPRREGLRVGPGEICELIGAAREEGVWDFLGEG
jgi:hypothetical protein